MPLAATLVAADSSWISVERRLHARLVSSTIRALLVLMALPCVVSVLVSRIPDHKLRSRNRLEPQAILTQEGPR